MISREAMEAARNAYDIERDCIEEMKDFCLQMGITPIGKVRGAFLPSGLDVLLRFGSSAYFVGDAAGLIKNTSGEGIVYALLSARLLAEALSGGTPYEEAMAPYTEAIIKKAKDAKKIQFLKCFTILAKGTPAR